MTEPIASLSDRSEKFLASSRGAPDHTTNRPFSSPSTFPTIRGRQRRECAEDSSRGSGIEPMHREYHPDQMGLGHSHAAGDEHGHDAELRALVATTVVVGVLLAADLILAAWGSP